MKNLSKRMESDGQAADIDYHFDDESFTGTRHYRLEKRGELLTLFCDGVPVSDLVSNTKLFEDKVLEVLEYFACQSGERLEKIEVEAALHCGDLDGYLRRIRLLLEDKKPWRFIRRTGNGQVTFLPKVTRCDPQSSFVQDEPANLAVSFAYRLPKLGRCIGRDQEIDDGLARWLTDRENPLLVWGPPGIGKTTLARAILHRPEVQVRFEERRFQLRCDGLKSASEVKARMGLEWFGQRPSPTVGGRVLQSLAEAPAAILLDNFETPYQADPAECEEWIKTLLQVENVWIIVAIQGREKPAGISWSDPLEPSQLSLESARSLFCSITGLASDFQSADLDQILDDLSGVPRAVELLAHQAGDPPNLDWLAKRWEAHGTGLLKRVGGAFRDTSLPASYEFAIASPLLDDGARRLLRVLACLPAGIHENDVSKITDAVGETTPLDAAAQLIQTALAFHESGRVRLLAPMRDHVQRQHKASAEETLLAREHFLQVAYRDGYALGKAGGSEAFSLLSSEFPNLLWAVEESLEAALDRHRDHSPDYKGIVLSEGRGFAALQVLVLFSSTSGIGQISELVEQAVRLTEETGDTFLSTICLSALGEIARRGSNLVEAARWHERALSSARAEGDVIGEVDALVSLGDVARCRRDYVDARRILEEALTLSRREGLVINEARSLQILGHTALDQQPGSDEAGHCFEEALPLFQQLGDKIGEASCVFHLGDIVKTRLNSEGARQYYEEALGLYQEAGDIASTADCNLRLADFAVERSDFAEARRCFKDALQVYQRLGRCEPYQVKCRMGLGVIAIRECDDGEVRRHFEEALPLVRRIGDRSNEGFLLLWFSLDAAQQGKYAEAHQQADEARSIYQQLGDEQAEAQCTLVLDKIAADREVE